MAATGTEKVFEGAEHKFSTTQFNLPKSLSKKIKAFADAIPDEDLADDGREAEPHITVRYGLHTGNAEDVQRVLAGQEPVVVTLGKTSLFESDEYDVVKVSVEGAGLVALNELLGSNLENTQTHSGYQPHATIAYVKSGAGSKYADDNFLEGEQVTIDHVVFSDQDDKQVKIMLQAQKEMAQPGQAAVHVPAPMGTDKKTAKKKTPNSHFMQRMIVSMMERYSEEEIAAFKKTAAAHAGGMTKAERAKLAAMQDELYKESMPDMDDDEEVGDGFAVGDRVRVTVAPHQAGQSTGVVKIVKGDAYGILFDGTKSVHKWYEREELELETQEGRVTKMAEKTASEAEDEAAESLTAELQEIETAFRAWAQIPNVKPGEWPDCKYWCREVFSDYVIAEDCKTGELCKIPFQENTSDGYDFGTPVKVEISYVTASEVGDLCAEGNGWRLFVEHDFAEAPEWMPLLPKPGKYKHPKYGDIKLTAARNANFADGVNKKIYQSSLPINTEHAPSNEGAFGWIEEARQNDDGSVDARVSWTDLGKDAIGKDRFRFISPEWADECESPDGKKLTDVIRGAAMTVRPFFKDKHLRPLVASERGLETLDHPLPASDEPQLFFFTALLPSEPASQPETLNYKEPTPMAGKENIETPPEAPVEKPVINAAEPTVDALKFAELETKLLALEAENLANKQAAEIQATEVKKLSEANARLTDEAETLKFTEEVEGKSKDNKHAYVGEFAKHVAHMKSLAKAFGEDSEEIKFYMETQRQSAALAESSLLFAEKGRGGAGGDGTPWGKIVGIAKSRMETDKTLTEAMAISLVLKDQPQLYAEYQASEGN